MADVLRLLAKVRGFFSRLAARRLLAKRLPRGLREARLALRAAPAQPPPGEFWTAGAHPAPLLRLRALPPSQSAGVLDPRKFRLDPATQAPANEQILPLWRRDPSHRWLLPAFRRRFVDLPWMARDRALFLGPTAAEWFCMWWEQSLERGLGGRQPEQWERPDEVDWAMDECKEQMLIRRDVAKDEHAPSPAEAVPPRIGHPVDAWNAQSLDELIPAGEWVETAQPRAMAPFPPLAQARKEAYLRWRTLLDALADG